MLQLRPAQHSQINKYRLKKQKLNYWGYFAYQIRKDL